MRGGWHRITVVGLALSTVSSPALAHSSVRIGDFYNGLLHPLIHFETLLPALALALWAAQFALADAVRALSAFVLAAFLGAIAAFADHPPPGASTILAAAMFAIGISLAAMLRPPLAVTAPLALFVGFTIGSFAATEAREEIQRPILYLLGIPTGVGLLSTYIVGYLPEYIDRFPWLRIACRVVGSWIAAAGLLVLVLHLTGAHAAPP